MSPSTIALIVIAVSVALWGLFMANVTIRRQRRDPSNAAATREHPAEAGHDPVTSPAQSASEPRPAVTVEKVPPAERKPLSPGELAVSRRQFLNRAWTASFTAFLGFFGMSSLSFLWPTLTGGFGTKINAGNYEDILAKVGPDGGFTPLFIPEGRFYLTYYEGTGDAPVYTAVNAVDTKLQALYRKCVHLGCSVPKCDASKLFECPCHGSKYRLHGEFYAGPAPRGLDRFPITIEDGKVMVDTGSLQEGPPRGTSTWDRFAEPQGPFCVPV
ncbi:MAG TPA: ubiquinol-cytochrome c reductase iron-sulfur subunit [Actinomycetota bacterium]|nr:ubiquinol-cytochrome c reductase iron-sulfur subunit [Actinomycetota bacterium]